MLLCAQHVLPVSSAPIENGAVLVKDGKIADIGKADMLRIRYAEEEVRDFGTAAICPGLINLYARLEDAIFRGLMSDVPYAAWMKEISDLRRRLSAEESYESAYLGALESLASGITTVGDISTTGSAAKAADKVGLRAVVYREISAIDKNLVNYSLKKGVSDLENGHRSSSPIAFRSAWLQPRCSSAIHSSIRWFRSTHSSTTFLLPCAWLAAAKSIASSRMVARSRATYASSSQASWSFRPGCPRALPR